MVRADLHARFADWLDEHGHALVERDEIIGYHLEQAARYQADLGRTDSALAERAALRLAAAGRRAKDRLDGRAALALFNRAVELLRPHRLELALELEAAWATAEVDGRVAVQAADTVAERAEAAGDRSGAMLARAMALCFRVISGEFGSSDEQDALCRAALPLEEERADPGGSRSSGPSSPSPPNGGCGTTRALSPSSERSATFASPATLRRPSRWSSTGR